MRSSLKLLGRSALLVAICVAVGFALLLAAFALPTEPMRENALASQDVFAREGSYPMVRTLGVDAKLDNFTDSMMLVQAGYQAPETTLLQRTLNVYRPFPHGNRGARGRLCRVPGRARPRAREQLWPLLARLSRRAQAASFPLHL